MVQMSDTELQGKQVSQPPKRVQQDHRIGTAGDSDEHGMAALEHLMLLDGLLNPLKEDFHSPGVQGGHVG
jgi:hypothetical protein